MTQTTEKDRASLSAFIEMAEREGFDTAHQWYDAKGWVFFSPPTADCWRYWQAARRAPAVPWGVESAAEAIYEADKRMWLTSVEYQKLHNDDKGRLRAMARAALAAAPQPPKAESMISSREVVSNPGSGVKVTRLNLSEAGREALQSKASHIPEIGFSVSNATLAAPVQMPEPVGVAFTFEIDEGGPVASQITSNPTLLPMGWSRLYTEQQVRQLLAAHGIEVAP